MNKVLLLMADHFNLIEFKSIKIPKYFAVNGFIRNQRKNESRYILKFIQLFSFIPKCI